MPDLQMQILCAFSAVAVASVDGFLLNQSSHLMVSVSLGPLFSCYVSHKTTRLIEVCGNGDCVKFCEMWGDLGGGSSS